MQRDITPNRRSASSSSENSILIRQNNFYNSIKSILAETHSYYISIIHNKNKQLHQRGLTFEKQDDLTHKKFEHEKIKQLQDSYNFYNKFISEIFKDQANYKSLYENLQLDYQKLVSSHENLKAETDLAIKHSTKTDSSTDISARESYNNKESDSSFVSNNKELDSSWISFTCSESSPLAQSPVTLKQDIKFGTPQFVRIDTQETIAEKIRNWNEKDSIERNKSKIQNNSFDFAGRSLFKNENRQSLNY